MKKNQTHEKFRILLAEYYAPASILIDKDNKIAEVFGNVHEYLENSCSADNVLGNSLEDCLKKEFQPMVFALAAETDKVFQPASAVLDVAGGDNDKIKIIVKQCEQSENRPQGSKTISFSRVVVEGLDLEQGDEVLSGESVRKKLEIKLIEMQKRIRGIENIMDSFDYAVMVLNQNFEIYKYNENMFKIMKALNTRTVKEFLSRIYLETGHEEIQNKIKDVVLGKRRRFKFEYSIISDKEEEKSYACTASYILNAEDVICGAVLVHDDITERKKWEKRIVQEKNEYLNQNKRKTLFLANLSHELKNPLNAVQGFTELLNEAIDKGRGHDILKKYSENIYEGAAHLESIVRRILDMAKLQSGTVILKEEKVPFMEIYNSAKTIISALYPWREVAFVAEKQISNLAVMCDKNLTMELLINLITNALKYSEINTEVTFEVSYDSSVGLTMEVRDKGFGMDDLEIKVALEPFGQNVRHFESRNSGLGLGLPFSVYIAQVHGGDLKIYSQKNKGTQIKVIFPVQRIHLIKNIEKSEEL